MSVTRTLAQAARRALRSRPRLLARLARAAALLAAAGAPLAAQDLVPPTGEWRTLETRWFAVHYPVEAEGWTRDLATRLDAIRDSVAVRVGWAPERRVTIVVTDPENLPNGSAWPSRRQPAILLYPTAPRPVDQIGNHRGWGDKLAAHEFAHIAHLSRPARRRQWWWVLAPDQPSPIVLGTPRWAIEGYATHIEGRITGSGRPYGAWRAALLRALALEGRLPSYAGMSATGGYKGGSYAYLVGSAFWDWLARAKGDTAMPLVFRRQTARTRRGFDAAFAGVFGAAPQELYGRFVAEVTAAAVDAEDALAPTDTTMGRRLVRFRHDPGALALSPDGTRLAHALPGTASLPPRLVVTTADTAARDSAAARRDSVRRAAARGRDPLDVEAIRVDPPAPRIVRTLRAHGGRIWRRPRFVTDSLVLVEALVLRRDGTRRPELFTWSLRDGAVRAVTRDAGVGDADPSPDGRRAVGIRCVGGACAVVEVTLADGAVRTLVRGTPGTRWAQPRWSPDGATIVLAGSGADGTWRLASLDLRTTGAQPAWRTPDDGVDRHSPAWFADGRRLAYVTERGGMPDVATGHLDSLASDAGEVRRTRVATSAWSPVVAPDGALLYTREHATGHEVRRIDAQAVTAVAGVALADSLWPVRPLARRAAVVLPAQPIAPARPYGLGPRSLRVLPQFAGGIDGGSSGLTLAGTDPVGRLGWTLAGLLSDGGGWRGGSAAVAWRGHRPQWRAEAAALDLPAGAQRDAGLVAPLRAGWQGASLGVVLPVAGDLVAHRAAVTVAGGRHRRGDAWTGRALAAASWSTGALVAPRTTLSAGVTGAAGTTADDTWRRGIARVGVRWRAHTLVVRAGWADDRSGHERFTVGGQPTPLVDDLVLGERIAAPLLPAGTIVSARLVGVRVATPLRLLPGTLAFEGIGPSARWASLIRTVGWEASFDTPRLDLIGVPSLQVASGVGVVLDAPLRHRVTSYIGVRVHP